MTLALAIWLLLVAAFYGVLYVAAPQVASALLEVFVGLVVVPMTLHDVLFIKRQRRRETDR